RFRRGRHLQSHGNAAKAAFVLRRQRLDAAHNAAAFTDDHLDAILKLDGSKCVRASGQGIALLRLALTQLIQLRLDAGLSDGCALEPRQHFSRLGNGFLIAAKFPKQRKYDDDIECRQGAQQQRYCREPAGCDGGRLHGVAPLASMEAERLKRSNARFGSRVTGDMKRTCESIGESSSRAISADADGAYPETTILSACR